MRALISVSDRSGAVDLARRLVALGWGIISSGGTAATLRAGGVDVTEVAEVTGVPEMLDGRVKTLHPMVHGGILADRSKPEHLADLAAAGAEPIDLVVCNLYPFSASPSIEMIDIGGFAMLRAAAKNHAHVGVVVDPADYGSVLEELEAGGALSESLRRSLARKAFAHCSGYDAAVVAWLDAGAPERVDETYPGRETAAERAPETPAPETPPKGLDGASPGREVAPEPVTVSAAASAAEPVTASAAASAAEPVTTSPAASAAEPVTASAAEPVTASAAASAAEPVTASPAASPAASAPEVPPESLVLRLRRTEVLRYGENPDQLGARYRLDDAASWWDTAAQLGGKQLSYLNVYDTDAAWRLAHALGPDPAAVIVKHANPCGAAAHADIAEAYRRAHACDPVSAFGGVAAFNRTVSTELAESLAEVFTEVVVAPGYDAGALERLQAKRNLRILQAGAPEMPELQLRSLGDSFLVQTAPASAAPGLAGTDLDGVPCVGGEGFGEDAPDGSVRGGVDARDAIDGWKVVTERPPSDGEWRDLVFAWRIVAAVSSNAIVVAKGRCAVGIGAGQQNRRDAGHIAAAKAGERGRGGAYASDAFFPFADGLDGAVEAGCTAVVQPGGSVRDAEVIEAANDHGMAMVFTGRRAFRH